MKRRDLVRSSFAAGALAAVPAAAAPEWSNPFAKQWRDSFAEHWKDTREYTLAIFDAMPADGIDSKPNPAQRTFGEQFVHIGRANAAYMTSFGLKPAPAVPEGTSRDIVRGYLVSTFDYVDEILRMLSEKDLLRTDLKFNPKLKPHSGTDLFMRAYMHTAHHRGQAVVYLRVKGITPPAWKFEPTT